MSEVGIGERERERDKNAMNDVVCALEAATRGDHIWYYLGIERTMGNCGGKK